MVRAGIYVRISDDKVGEALGVDRQESDCRALCQANGWDVAQVYVDNDVSATRSRRRAAYEGMLDAVRAGQLDAVVVAHLYRLYRQPRELEDFIDLADLRRLKLANCAGPVDLATSQGRMVARIMGATGKYESELIAERVARKQEELRAAGKPYNGGVRTYGWAKNQLDLVPEEAEIIREMARRVIAGEACNAIARDLNRRGVPTITGAQWSRTVVSIMLKKPRLVGRMIHKGRDVGEGAWKPILDRATWERVLAVLEDPARKTRLVSNQRKYLLSGIARCAVCTSPMGPHFPSKRAMETKGANVRYQCRGQNTCGSISRERLDDYVLAQIVAHGKYGGQLLAAGTQIAGVGPVDQELTDEIEQLEQRQIQIAQRVGLGSMTDAQFEVANQAMNGRLRELRGELASRQRTQARWVPMPRGLVAEVVPALPFPDKRRLIEESIDRIVVTPPGQGKPFNPANVEIAWR